MNKAQIIESRSDRFILTAKFGLVAIAFAAILLLTLNLTSAPESWLDEGLYLNIARTISEQGVYGMEDGAGIRIMDPASQSGTGPTVILLVALVFKIFGIGLLQARLLMVVFGLLAFGAYGLLARRIVGKEAALLSLILLLVGNGNWQSSFVPMARQVLGEVPGMGLILLGTWLWLRAIEASKNRNLQLLLAGTAFGLGLVAKTQLLVVFPVAWVVFFIANQFYYKQTTWKAFFVPVLPIALLVGAWYSFQYLLLGPEGFQRNSAILREAFGIQIIGFDLNHMREALGVLWRIGFVFWGLPGLLYGFYLTAARNRQGFNQASIFIFASLWFGWWAILSNGWPRYGFIGFALLLIWTASLLVDFTKGMLLPSRSKWQVYLVGIILAGWLAFGVTATLGDIFNPPPNYLTQFATYLKENVPPAAVVANWEWELDLAAPQNFLHPSTSTLNEFISAKSDNRPFTYRYTPGSITPEYVVDGLFSNWSEIYLPYLQEHGEKIVQIGPYSLYKVVNNK